jgi:hypothetical protein
MQREGGLNESDFSGFLILALGKFSNFLAPHASAQYRGVDACAILAGSITPGIPRQVTSGPRISIFQQLRDRVYFKCLQLHGQRAAPVVSATAKAGTFTTFDVPGAVSPIPTKLVLDRGHLEERYSVDNHTVRKG